MIGVVVVTHGQLAVELLNAAEMIVGDLPRFTAVSIGWHDDVNDAREDIAQAIERVRGSEGVLLLTDMFGGTPSNLGMTFLETDRLEVITGVNLPMLIKLAGLRESANSYRFWDPDTVIEQIDVLVNRHGVRNLKIADEMFVLNRRHVLGICDRLIERDYGLNIWAYTRVDTVKDGMLDKLKAAGFNWLAFGIEAGADRVRAGVDKAIDQDEVYRVIERVRGAGLLEPIRERAHAGMPYAGASAGANLAGPTILTTNDWNVVALAHFGALHLVPFNINPHYKEVDPAMAPGSETREDRIREYHVVNGNAVVGIEEETMIRFEDGVATVLGRRHVKLFRPGLPPRWVTAGERIPL